MANFLRKTMSDFEHGFRSGIRLLLTPPMPILLAVSAAYLLGDLASR